MNRQLYRINVTEVMTVISNDGVTVTDVPVRTYVTETLTPEDALMAVGDQLHAEEAS